MSLGQSGRAGLDLFLPFWFTSRIMSDHPLKAYRTDRGKSQDELAAFLGVSSVTVSRWETGARKIDKDRLAEISKKTGIPARELRPDLAKILEGAR